MTTIIKTYDWENFWSSRREECRFKEVFVGEVSGGTALRESDRLGSVHEEVSVGELCGYQFLRETAMKSSKKLLS